MPDAATDFAALQPTLADVLSERGGLGAIEPMALPRRVADHADKALLRDAAGRPLAVLVVSPALRPDAAAQAAARARAAIDVLGPGYADAVLAPWHEGELDGRSYTVTAFRQPLSGRRWLNKWQRWRLAPAAWGWLLGATRRTLAEPDAAEREREFARPLARIATLASLPPAVRRAGDEALQALERGRWSPKLVFAHYDLWSGNLLLAPHAPGFAVIDWGTARARGHAVYDLVRLAPYLGHSRRERRAQLLAHCEVLGCSAAQARHHLAAALGHLAGQLDHWPLPRFVETASRTMAELDAMVA